MFYSGCYPVPSSSNMFDFGTTNYFPTGSRICGYSIVVLGIRSDMLFDWSKVTKRMRVWLCLIWNLMSLLSWSPLKILVGYFMELLSALKFSLSLSDSCVWSFVLMIASRFSSSFKNMYLEAQDFPVLQGLFSWYCDLLGIVAECLALLDAQVAAILLSISKLVCKSDCKELVRLL
ncbi:hypothetical protein YC2023_024036 [Brassica napus]